MSEPSVPRYRDPDQPLQARVADLLSRLTLTEKIGMMISAARAVPRLGIPAYDFWSEALHGVARNGRATVFPQAIGMAATWDPALIKRIGSAIGDEARAKHHAALQRNGFTARYQGLTMWSPNINIFRDPRWGRGQETWGEDPCLTGELGSAFVRGLQGDDPNYLKAAACAKHFAVHSGPESLRHSFDAQVSPQDLHATYLPAFKKLVTEAKVEAVMGAYNRVNGQPCCASPALLADTLRDAWGFQGHVVSDCWALSDIHKNHKVTRDAVESAALALKAGCDLSCMCTYDHLGAAILRGLITEADIDRSLARSLATRFKLGMFDPPERVPYSAIPLSVVNGPAHRSLTYEAAAKSLVLLKNDGVLPIGAGVRSIAVVGPHAANADVLLGNYHGMSENLVTALEGIAARIPEGMGLTYRYGCPVLGQIANPVNYAFNEAGDASMVIACMGLSPQLEGEEGDAIFTAERGDRTDLALPAVQISFLHRLLESGAPLVLVLFGGSPIALGDLADKANAVLWVGYPGQEGGHALADILFGSIAPSGKLPVTFPAGVEQLPAFDDYRMAGRTYRYATAEPLYPFGFGLSYTTFAYHDLHLERPAIAAGESLRVSLEVTNTGSRPAEEVVQFYLTDLEASVTVPLCSLVGFRRVALAARATERVEFTLDPEMLLLVDAAGQRRLEPGAFRLSVGGCSPSPRAGALGAPAPAIATFVVQ